MILLILVSALDIHWTSYWPISVCVVSIVSRNVCWLPVTFCVCVFLQIILLVQLTDTCCLHDNCKISLILLMSKKTLNKKEEEEIVSRPILYVCHRVSNKLDISLSFCCFISQIPVEDDKPAVWRKWCHHTMGRTSSTDGWNLPHTTLWQRQELDWIC